MIVQSRHDLLTIRVIKLSCADVFQITIWIYISEMNFADWEREEKREEEENHENCEWICGSSGRKKHFELIALVFYIIENSERVRGCATSILRSCKECDLNY